MSRMFLPVACLKCGKLFQVPEAAAGTDVSCPFCKQSTAALPVAGTPAAPPEPLSLDDDPPPVRTSNPRPGLPMLAKFAIVGVLSVIALVATIAALRYGSGEISPASWTEFTAPDHSCSIQLPGTPVEEVVEPKPDDAVVRGLHQYTTTGWYSRARTWFGWRDLDPAWVKQAQQDRDGAIISPVLTGERDRRKSQLQGTITKEATVRFLSHLGLEVWMDSPRGNVVERYLVALDGPRPRLYFFGIQAKNAKAEGDAAQHLFNSFRINKD